MKTYRVRWAHRENAYLVTDGSAVVARADDLAEAGAVVEAFMEADAERLKMRRRQAQVARQARLRLTEARARVVKMPVISSCTARR